MKIGVKRKLSLLATTAVSAIFFLQSCKPDIPPTKDPVRYEIDDFIFNTFLFSKGSWWSLVDTVSGDRDTLMITESVAQHQNVYEGSELKYYRFYYEAKLWSTSNQKATIVEYLSNSFATYNNEPHNQVLIYHNKYPRSFYVSRVRNNDSLAITAAFHNGIKKVNYFVMNNIGDSLSLNGKWRKGRFVHFRHSNVEYAAFKDLTFVFQEHFGLVSYKSNGSHFIVENSELYPVIQ